jgi:rRNA-processing protein FCF1
METNRLRYDQRLLILLDTSGLIHALSRKINLDFWFNLLFQSPYRLALTRPVFEELRTLAALGKRKTSMLASLALKLCSGYVIINTDTFDADTSLLEAALKHKCIVFTCDSKLKQRLTSHGVLVVTITNDNRMVLSS